MEDRENSENVDPTEGFYGDIVFESEPSVGSCIFYSSDNNSIDEMLHSVSSVGGVQLWDALQSLVASYVGGKIKILPKIVLPVAEELDMYCEVNKLVPSLLDLNLVLTHVPCCIYRHGEWQDILQVWFPYTLRTEYLGKDYYNNLGVVTESGYYACSGDGHHTLNYIVRKYDGTRYIHIVMRTNVVFGMSIYNNVAREDEIRAVFVGEVTDTGHDIFKLHLSYGYDRSLLPHNINIENVSHIVEQARVLNVETFLIDRMPEETDGYIFCIDGMEFKVKPLPTYDVRYDAAYKVMRTKDNKKYDVIPDKTLVDGLIYECDFVIPGRMRVIRRRADKTIPQHSDHFQHITTAPTPNDMRVILRGCTNALFERFDDKMSVDVLVRVVVRHMCAQRSDVFTLSVTSIRANLRSLKICVDRNMLTEVFRRMVISLDLAGGRGGPIGNHYRVSLAKLLDLNFAEPKYASCKSIYDWCLTKKISTSPAELARLMSGDTGRIVSVRKIHLMALRGELSSHGYSLGAHQCCGRWIRYRRLVTPRHLQVTAVSSVYDALARYSMLNGGRAGLESDLKSLREEDAELYSECAETESLCEFGDVMMIWTKVILRLYTDGRLIEESDARVWKILYGMKSMQPFIAKMTERVKRYNCVRNHRTCGPHVCSSGAEFKG